MIYGQRFDRITSSDLSRSGSKGVHADGRAFSLALCPTRTHLNSRPHRHHYYQVHSVSPPTYPCRIK